MSGTRRVWLIALVAALGGALLGIAAWRELGADNRKKPSESGDCDGLIASGRLTTALRALTATEHFPAHRTHNAAALATLRDAVKEYPRCAVAYEKLAFGLYWDAYQPCQSLSYAEPELVATQGNALPADNATHLSLRQTLGRIHAAQGRFDDAVADFTSAEALGKSSITAEWLNDVRIFQAPSPGLQAALATVAAGETLDPNQLEGLDAEELHWILEGLEARQSGRQFNKAPLDVFFYCTGRRDHLNPEAHSDGELTGVARLNWSIVKAAMRAAPAPPTLSPEQTPAPLEPPSEADLANDAVENGLQFPPPAFPEGINDSQYPQGGNAFQLPPIDPHDTFQSLDGAGQWVNEEELGDVWQPNPEAVTADFEPYETQGQWTLTDQGWVFASSFSWGWLTFHYGRWWFDGGLGWVWVPGNKWAPAWVQWVDVAGGKVGWQPLPPEGKGQPSSARNHSTWHFVAKEDLGGRELRQRLIEDSSAAALLRASTREPADKPRGPLGTGAVSAPIQTVPNALPPPRVPDLDLAKERPAQPHPTLPLLPHMPEAAIAPAAEPSPPPEPQMEQPRPPDVPPPSPVARAPEVLSPPEPRPLPPVYEPHPLPPVYEPRPLPPPEPRPISPPLHPQVHPPEAPRPAPPPVRRRER